MTPSPSSELILHQTENGRTRIECCFKGELSVTHAERAALEVG
jgi:hypothetical protein